MIRAMHAVRRSRSGLWLIVAGQGADLVTFFAAAAVLPAQAEANIVAAALLGEVGLAGVFLAKVAVLTAMLALVDRVARSAPAWITVTAAAIPTLAGFAAAAANLVALVVTLGR